jgi:hypothetical protein
MKYREIVLIDRDGKEAARIPAIPHDSLLSNAWIFQAGKWWGFGVGKLNGEAHFYEASPERKQLERG